MSLEYLVDKLLKKNLVNTIIGSSGAGKTKWTLGLLDAMERNVPYLGFETKPLPKTFYVALDRGEQEFEDSLEKLYPNLLHSPNFQFISLATRLREVGSIYKLLESVPVGTELLVVDGVGFTVDKIISQRAVGIVISDFLNWCKKTGGTCALIHHTAKVMAGKAYKNPREKGAGSGAWAQMSATTVVIEQVDPEDIKNPDRLAFVMQNNVAGFEVNLTINEQGMLIKGQTQRPKYPPLSLENHVGVHEWLRELPDEFSTKDALRVIPLSHAQVERYLQHWIELSLIERLRKGVYTKKGPSV